MILKEMVILFCLGDLEEISHINIESSALTVSISAKSQSLNFDYQKRKFSL